MIERASRTENFEGQTIHLNECLPDFPPDAPFGRWGRLKFFALPFDPAPFVSTIIFTCGDEFTCKAVSSLIPVEQDFQILTEVSVPEIKTLDLLLAVAFSHTVTGNEDMQKFARRHTGKRG